MRSAAFTVLSPAMTFAIVNASHTEMLYVFTMYSHHSDHRKEFFFLNVERNGRPLLDGPIFSLTLVTPHHAILAE